MTQQILKGSGKKIKYFYCVLVRTVFEQEYM